MEYKAIVTIINLLTVTCRDHQELILISRLNSYFNFDFNVFILSSSSDKDRYINTAGQMHHTPQSLFDLENVEDSFIGLEGLKEIKSKNPFFIIVPDGVSLERNRQLLTRAKEIQRLKVNLKIGVFLPDVPSHDDLHRLFAWCWQQQIINIFATFYSYPDVIRTSPTKYILNIFTYKPFGKFGLINITGNGSLDNFFISQESDFQEYQLRVGRPWPIVSDSYNEKLWRIVFSRAVARTEN